MTGPQIPPRNAADIQEAATTLAPSAAMQPDPARAGLVRHNGGAFEHYCATCGAWGAWGYSATARADVTWFCRAHRPTHAGGVR